ncbi:DpnI domain-containing protein [Roseovarius sp. EL26]|uniref:DpnI domain-containing protein n=1 Tax=Roseovarius sp. EL26 TaxID=2126672 RepID=UPI001C200271|nr:DpnI domain-containing protein [Roseovarius sp. EL26]
MKTKTKYQTLGDFGEAFVAKNCQCPSCKRNGTQKLLPTNFKCADIICDFCGYLSQVKTARSKNINVLPDTILGAAWNVQNERMQSGIYFSLFVVLVNEETRHHSIFFLSKDLQTPDMFVPRKPLSSTAKRAGWQGFKLDIKNLKNRFVRIF